MPVIPYKADSPVIGNGCFVAPDAWITGKSELGEQVSVFFAAILRGDINRVSVGAGTNIQEHAMLHTSTGLGDCIVGSRCTIGHRAIIHGCTIGDSSLIGMGATILDDATIGSNVIIGANSLVTMNTEIPDGVLALGSPAKVIREITDVELAQIEENARHYIEVGAEYREYFTKAPSVL